MYECENVIKIEYKFAALPSVFFTLISSVCFLVLSLLPTTAQAQVYSGNLTLSTQAEIDAFGYSSISGYLVISGPDMSASALYLKLISHLPQFCSLIGCEI